MENIDNKQSEARQRNLLRFVHAQDNGGIYEGTATYAEALQEVKNGHKRSHWIWYVFPQMKGLGKSEISQYYGINGREEARAYIEHPILRDRLVEISEAVLNNEKSESVTGSAPRLTNSRRSSSWARSSPP